MKIVNYIPLFLFTQVETVAASGGVQRKNVFFKITQKFIGKPLCQSLFLNKVASLRPASLFEKRDSGTGVSL